MHYTAMLAYRGIGDTAAAEREQKLFQRFKADESSQAITAKPRMLSPEDNNERQAIHDHESIPGGPVNQSRCNPAPREPGSLILDSRRRRRILPQRKSGHPGSIHDVTAQAGIKFVHNAGKAGKKYLPETLGSGAAFFDADGDGWIDILLVNGKDWTPRGRRTTAALYRNNHNGTFTDITRGSGLDVEMYGIGVAVADYDNDGRDDVYITALGWRPPLSQRGQRQVQRRDRGIRNQERQLSAPAPHGWITIATESSTCSSPIMFSGARRAICGARWMAT